jgi:regulator of CtrA degradation
MSNTGRSGGDRSNAPIRFIDKLANSDTFGALFQDGMTLVEETATYLDGCGREESKLLNRPGSLSYATESMRLTTRLMQLASWLLLQRAVNEGEMSHEQADPEKAKVKLDALSSSTEGAGWDDLPEQLRDLITRSTRLQKRVRHLDESLSRSDHLDARKPGNPVAAQLNLLSAAFDPSNTD